MGLATRENHGYTVPARWLADLDAMPDGDTGEPESGYLVGDQNSHGSNAVGACPIPWTPGHADGGTRSKGRPAMTERCRPKELTDEETRTLYRKQDP